MDLICYLVSHRDRVLSKQEIAGTIWPEVCVAETSLRWLLKEVRRYLGDTGSRQQYVETLRGYGLRWAAPVTIIPCLGPDVRRLAASSAE
jgi:DNA-binding winged helix-turn-helix (wHTH) protein